MLLTRSRLCPRPKPGSSLHLHVLGTPPAFVLSQDQTLREELLRRVVRRYNPSNGGDLWSPPATGQNPGPVPGGTRPLRPHEGAQSTQEGSGTQDGVNLGTAVRALPEGERSSDGVEPGHTSRPTNRPKSAHAVEFSKTVAPLQEGTPPQGARPDPETAPGRTDEYSARIGPCRVCDAVGSGRCSAHLQDTTWTLTVRCRGRSSKSISTICCQVPSANRPPTRGIVSEGPINAARRCAWELESWLRRLCS